MSGRSSEASARRARRNGLSKYSGDWKGFADVVLTGDQKEHLSSLEPEDYPDLIGFIYELLEDGYKLSLVRDEAHSCVIATATGTARAAQNQGWSLSARGATVEGALLVLRYKHVEICQAGAWTGEGSANSSQLSMWG
jgi:hypothetical protein